MPGNKTTHAARVAGKNGFSLISDDKFREIYAALLKCSLLDAKLHAHKGYIPWIGCCAAAAGIVPCLRLGDSITSTRHSVLAEYLLHSKFELYAGKPALTPTSQLAITTGDALRHMLEKQGNIAVIFTGAAEPDAMQSIFSIAAKQALPALYVLEGGTPAAELCEGIPVIRVDATDVVAVYRVAYESIIRARANGGPTIIECATWPDDRGNADTLKKYEDYLAAKNLFRRDWKQRLEKKYGDAIAAAVGRTQGK